MAAPDGDDLRKLKECVRAFDESASHLLRSMRELLMAGRCLFDVAIECVDRLSPRGKPAPEAKKVEIQ